MTRLSVLLTVLLSCMWFPAGVHGEEPIDFFMITSNPLDGDTSFSAVLNPRGMMTNVSVSCHHYSYEYRHFEQDELPVSIIFVSNRSSRWYEVNGQPHESGVVTCAATAENNAHVTNKVTSFHLSQERHAQPVSGRFTIAVYAGERVDLNVTVLRPFTSYIRWTHFRPGEDHGDRVEDGRNQMYLIIKSAAEYDQGIYITSGRPQEWPYSSIIRLIVNDCPRGRWGPLTCLGVCDNCYNGGVCHELSATCICPPGFTGKNCLRACGKHRYGSACDRECGPAQALASCAGSQFCFPDPYGCNCLSGYTGVYCNETCRAGEYGVDCRQECHCSGGSTCDIFTGRCPGECERDWTGPSCQVPLFCPVGYYGEHCGETCHCRNNTPCVRETGYCRTADGACAPGYMTDPSEGNNCIHMGCFDSCSKTCHCAGGAEDCDTVTGQCSSNRCRAGWTGQYCQIVSPILSDPPTLIRADCSDIFLTWNAWNPDRDRGDGPIGSYDVLLKTPSSDWSKIARVVYLSPTSNTIAYVATGLKPDTEYRISISPVHESSEFMEGGVRGPELIVATLPFCKRGSATSTVKPHPSSASVPNPASQSNSPATVPWALFGVVLLGLVLGIGSWASLRMRRRMISESRASKDVTNTDLSGSKYDGQTSTVYQNPSFSPPDADTYQDLNFPSPEDGNGDGNVYEMPADTQAHVYGNNVKVLKH